MVLNSSPSKRPMGGQPKSEASSLSSAEVSRLWEEPTEAIPQNQRLGARSVPRRPVSQARSGFWEALYLHSGSQRSEPHVDRKLSAAEAVESKRIHRGTRF